VGTAEKYLYFNAEFTHPIVYLAAAQERFWCDVPSQRGKGAIAMHNYRIGDRVRRKTSSLNDSEIGTVLSVWPHKDLDRSTYEVQFEYIAMYRHQQLEPAELPLSSHRRPERAQRLR
jgi:hypothetical protein